VRITDAGRLIDGFAQTIETIGGILGPLRIEVVKQGIEPPLILVIGLVAATQRV